MPAARVLLVEDEVKLLSILEAKLKDENFLVTPCSSFQNLREILFGNNIPFEIIVLDRLLHQNDAISIIPDIRSAYPQTKILVLSAINTPQEKANALNQGADDYLSKPFVAEELIARVHALLRRGNTELSLANITVDTIARNVSIDGDKLSLTNKEFLLLRTLLQFPGRVFDKTYLYEQVWEVSANVESNAVETAVSTLRKRLEEAGAKAQIKSARNIGYWIEE